MLLVTQFSFSFIEDSGQKPPEMNLSFSPPKALDTPNKGTCGVNPTSVDFSYNLDRDGELRGVGSVNGKKQQISCDPDVLMGVNLCYDGLLRLKLFEYKFYWNSRKDWKHSVGRFDGGGENTTWWMRHPVRWHGACAAGSVNVLRRRASDNIQNLVEGGGVRCLFSILPLQERSLTDQAFRFPTWEAKSSNTFARQSSWKRNLSTVDRSNILACLRQSLGSCFEIIMRYTRTGTSWKGQAPWSRCTVKARVNTK